MTEAALVIRNDETGKGQEPLTKLEILTNNMQTETNSRVKSFQDLNKIPVLKSNQIDRRRTLKPKEKPVKINAFLDLSKDGTFFDPGEIIYIMPMMSVLAIKVRFRDAKNFADIYHEWCIANEQLFLGRQRNGNSSTIYITKITDPARPNWDKEFKRPVIICEQRLVRFRSSASFVDIKDNIPHFGQILAGEYFGLKASFRNRRRVAFETYRWAKHMGYVYTGIIPYLHELAFIIRK